ncbi:MAG: hypothetical protein ACD_46C00023G0002 [uncultured bacterium]|nr:MAG: hypothetical protein ACD_46C00023G0002 [uncultured bacterium]
MMKKIIVWDLGATKCTAGIIQFDPSSQQLICEKDVTVKIAAADSLENLVMQIETALQMSMSSADVICIGAAGYYDGECLLLQEPYPYTMHFAKVAKQQAWPRFQIIHDYASIICATFTSYMNQPNHIKRLNQQQINPYGRRVAFGIGTGVGLKDGVLFPNGDFWLGQNEMGHIGVMTPPHASPHHRKRHEECLSFLREKLSLGINESLTFEKILAGKGTVRLYEFLYPSSAAMTPEELGVKMRAGETPELMDLFAWFLGLFIGTVQLSFMPEGGIWITGGVALNHLDVFDKPDFIAGIEATPAYLTQRKTYPLSVLCHSHHALMGCGYYAANRLVKNSVVVNY